ncbi:MAG: RcpC/CpaB family pilus assembly protein [Actinomycetota bacterium]
MDVSEARRVETPRWINARSVLGLLLFVGAVLAGQRVIAASDQTIAVWVAARPLAGNSAVTRDDLSLAQVRLPPELLSHYALGSRSLEGAVLTRPARAGELIAADWISDGPGAHAGRVMTIPMTSEHSVTGSVGTGDRIDVLATFDPEGQEARTVLIARGLEVVDVISAGGLVVGEESIVGITVALTPKDAVRLAFAIRTAHIDIARVVGSSEELGPGTARASDFP